MIHYIRDGASGIADGSDWTDAWDDLPATLTRGDTYYIADGSYNSYTFDDAESGATYIYIKKAIVADHGTGVGWNDNYGDGVAEFAASKNMWVLNTGYWDIDGQVGSGISGHGFKLDVTSNPDWGGAIDINDTDHIVIAHVEVSGYGEGANDDAVDVGGGGSDYLTFSYCYFHDQGRAPFIFSYSDYVTIEYGYFARNEATGEQHSEGVSSSDGTNFTIRYNIWEDIEGTGVILMNGSYLWVYGNVFFRTPSGGTISNGIVAKWSASPLDHVYVYNFFSL